MVRVLYTFHRGRIRVQLSDGSQSPWFTEWDEVKKWLHTPRTA